jgi:hypothetical protein
MNVYTYYEPVPGLWTPESQEKLLDIWAASWSLAGWTPIVLRETDARKHPRYDAFRKKFWELPTEYGHDYEGACFLRYAAVSAAGGGMMVDYDVINYGFNTVAPDPAKLIFYCDRSEGQQMSTGCVNGPKELYEGICQLFMEWTPDERDWNKSATYDNYHCSDLTFACQMFQGKRPRPDWVQLSTGCAIFPERTWKVSPLVHYPYSMRAAGYWPKHEHIETIRPFRQLSVTVCAGPS